MDEDPLISLLTAKRPDIISAAMEATRKLQGSSSDISPQRVQEFLDLRFDALLRDLSKPKGRVPSQVSIHGDLSAQAAADAQICMKNATIDTIDENLRIDPAELRKTRKRAMSLFDGYIRSIVKACETRDRKARGPRREKIDALAVGIIRSSHDAVVLLDRSGRVLMWNQAARELTGLTQKEATGKKFHEIFPETSGEVERLMSEQGDSSLVKGSFQFRHKSGEQVELFYQISLFTGDVPDSEERFILVFWDVSELNEMRARLVEVERLEAMARVAGSVAHEIRNPLNSLFLNTDLLEMEALKGMPENSSIPRILGAIREEIERLDGIITDYLSLSRLSDARREPLDISAFLTEVAAETRTRWSSVGIEVVEEVGENIPTVLVDRNQMRRALRNLINNARDAMPTGGRIVLAARRSNGKLIFEVDDTGVGMDRETLSKIATPFFTRKDGGTGLGVYLVNEIVLAHGGELRFESEPGKGTKAMMELPIQETAVNGHEV